MPSPLILTTHNPPFQNQVVLRIPAALIRRNLGEANPAFTHAEKGDFFRNLFNNKTMATRTYNTVPLQVAAFTFSVNSAADLSFTSERAMQSYVTKMAQVNLADPVLQGLVGADWAPVWGPVVWVNPSQQGTSLVADNTMACYYSPSQNLFIIAIAGTNPTSMFDWEKEDFDIASMVQWNTISTGSGSSSGYISTGSANGMTVLLGMQSESTTLLNALQSYIRTHSITGATIAVGGHSLGGALAPCLGLYLYDNLAALQLTGQTISVYAYAGPTPGDENFATYYNGRINGTTFTYSSQYNTIDVIPQGSVLAALATIPTIYGSNIPLPDNPLNTFLGVLTSGMQLASLAGSRTTGAQPYTQVSTNRTSFTAPFNSDVYNNCSDVLATEISLTRFYGVSSTYLSEMGNFVHYLYQAVAQHGPAYCGGTLSLPLPEIGNMSNVWTSQPVTGALGIDAFTTEYQLNLANNKPTDAAFDSGVARMIKKFTGVDLMTLQLPSKAETLSRMAEQEAVGQ